MKIKYLILVMILLVLPLVTSADYVFKQYQDIDLKIPCDYNGTFCNDEAVCNVSIEYPNGSLMLDNVDLTNTGNGLPNVTIPESTILGEFPGFATCEQNGLSDSWRFVMEINPTGDDRGNTLILILFISSFLLLIFAFFTENHIFAFFSGILFLISGVYSMIYGIADLSDLYTRSISMVILGFGLILIVSSGYELIAEYSEY